MIRDLNKMRETARGPLRQGRAVQGKGNSTYRDPEAEMCLAFPFLQHPSLHKT